MTILDETYALSNGVEIPKLGLGTWFIDDDKAADAVRAAIEIGYRNIDTAQAYGNERGVGEGVRTSGVPRDQLFVSTKLAAEIKDYDGAVAAIDWSLETTGLENADVRAMAGKYGVSVPQLCIRYTLQLGTVSLPKSANPAHLRSNAEVDFEIADEDVAALKGLHAQDYGDSSSFPVYSGKEPIPPVVRIEPREPEAPTSQR